MSSTIDLVKKKKVLFKSIDTGNGPKNEMSGDLHKLKFIRKDHLRWLGWLT